MKRRMSHENKRIGEEVAFAYWMTIAQYLPQALRKAIINLTEDNLP